MPEQRETLSLTRTARRHSRKPNAKPTQKTTSLERHFGGLSRETTTTYSPTPQNAKTKPTREHCQAKPLSLYKDRSSRLCKRPNTKPTQESTSPAAPFWWPLKRNNPHKAQTPNLLKKALPQSAILVGLYRHHLLA